MDLGLRDKTALVLGAGGGLGGAIAERLAAEGVRVAVADIDAAAAGRTVSAITERSGKAIALTWDLADLGMVQPNLETISKAFGPIDILVNITGGPPPTPVSGQPDAVWRKYFDAMVLSVIAITDAVLPGMRSQNWGRIITSTSSGVIAPIANLGLSNALRLSLVGWSKTLAREVGADGVTSNIIVPGRIATKRITFLDEQKANREGREVGSVIDESVGTIPVGRYGKPEEYADAVAFLASANAAYITGSVLRVDGGLVQSI